MNLRKLSIHTLTLVCVTILLSAGTAFAEVSSLTLTDIHATLPGETATVGFFPVGSTIALIYQFELISDTNETVTVTWDVYDRHGGTAYSGSRDFECGNGLNSVRVSDAIPGDMGTGTQPYDIYASVSVDGYKVEDEFEIRIEHPQAIPGVIIEDIRLIPSDGGWMADQISDAAIAYTLEIDFRVENILSWERARIQWFGVTAEGFQLDEGIFTTDIDEGFNSVSTESFIARPPYGAVEEADFSVEIIAAGGFDTVTFPLTSLPFSLMTHYSRTGSQADEYDFSVGEAYLMTSDGIRTGEFTRNEPVTARILTGGVIPENTRILMSLEDVRSDLYREYTFEPESGNISPVIDFDIPSEDTGEAGFYRFNWLVLTGDVIFGQRNTDFTVSDRSGIQIPQVIELFGDVTITVPLSWDLTITGNIGHRATMITDDGVVCRIIENQIDQPLNVVTLADMFESLPEESGIPSDATPLTSETSGEEGEWESLRRAWLTSGKIIVNDYWMYRIAECEFIFLVSTCSADEDLVTEAYIASDTIYAMIDLD